MHTIIYPPTIDYYWLYQRPQQLFKYLCHNGDYRVIFYNNQAYLPQPQPIQEIEPNFYVCTNRVSVNIDRLEERPVLWISYPPNIKYLGRFQEQLVVFDAIDDASEEFAYWNNDIPMLLQKADVIFVTSQKLYERYISLHPHVYLCPNAADYEHFSLGIHRCRPKDMPEGTRPTIGYCGALAPWLDWKLIKYVSARCPQWDFVFIGPLYGDFSGLVYGDNIYYLGRKSYEELPSYINCFDVCLIPFIKSNMTDAVNPVKLYEYFSVGKPVVSTDIYELKNMPLVSVAKNADQFIENIAYWLVNDNDKQKEKRREFAKRNSWFERALLVSKILELLMGG